MGDDLRYRLGLDGSAASRVLSGLQSGIGGLHGALLSLGAIGAFTKVLKDGFEFNQTLADSESAIAKVLAQFQGLDDAAAKASAAGAMQQLVDLEPKAAGTLNTLIDGFLSTLAASQAAGISVKQNTDLVGRFANAMANANIPTEQLGQEMRSIVTANIGADSSLAKVLGITNEMIQQAQAAGNVYDFLSQRIGKLGEAGDTAAVRFSSLQSAVQKAEGAFAEGFFRQAFDGSLELTNTFNDNIEAARSLGQAFAGLTAEIADDIAVITEWGQAWKVSFGIYADMLVNGVSEAEAMANAEDDLTDAINKRSEAAQAAAAASTQRGSQDMGGAGSGGGTPGPRPGKKRKEEDPEDVADETLKKTQELKELKRKGAEEEMTTAEKIAATRERLLEAAQREQAIKDVGVQDSRAALDAETSRVQIEQELNSLLRDQLRETQATAKAAADKAEAARKEVQAHNQSRNSLMGELAILEAQASGHDKKAKALQRQLQIETDKQSIMRETQASEEEALRLATRKADLQDKVAKRRDRDGTRDENQGAHIGGVTKSKRGFGGLAEFDALQKGPTAGLSIGVKPWASSLNAFKSMQRGGAGDESNIKLLGAGRGQALSDRMAQMTGPPKNQDNNKEDSAPNLLAQVVAELKRIRTA